MGSNPPPATKKTLYQKVFFSLLRQNFPYNKKRFELFGFICIISLCEKLYYNMKILIYIAGYIVQGGLDMRIGTGYDVHRLVENRKLIIGGVDIPYEKGLLGHSDADVLLHAIMDAILGAAALGDIGKHFPDTDEKYKGADSIMLLKEVARMIDEKNMLVGNIDATIIAQAPKLRPYIDEMRTNIANALSIDINQVNVKATTEEKLGFTGEGLGISAQAVCLLETVNNFDYRFSRDVSDFADYGCGACGGCPMRNS